MRFAEYLKHIKSGQELDRAAAKEFLGAMLDDDTIDHAAIAEALTILTKRGESTDEVLGFIDAMRARMIGVETDVRAIDVCGTGGDKSGTFNISTAAAIVLAAGEVPVAKHGNRSASSKCGSADVLEALHIPIDLASEAASKQLLADGFVFLFAQRHHPSLKKLAVVRKGLGFPTVFNLLGPLLNPAGVKRQVIGTFSPENAMRLCEVAVGMGYEHTIVLHSQDGLDEASLAAPTHLFELRDDLVVESRIKPSDFDLKAATIADLREGDSAGQNAQLLSTALQPTNKLSAHQRAIVLNAALGFYISGKAGSIASGVELAKAAIISGDAAEKLKQLATNR